MIRLILLLCFSLIACAHLHAMERKSIPDYLYKSNATSVLSLDEKCDYDIALDYAFNHLTGGNNFTHDFIKKVNELIRKHESVRETDMQPSGYYRTREITVYRDGLYFDVKSSCSKYEADLVLLQRSIIKIHLYSNCTIQSLVRDGILNQQEWHNFNKVIYIPTEPSKVYAEMSSYIAEIQRMISLATPIKRIAAYIHTKLGHIHPFDTGNGRTATILMHAFLLANNESAKPLPSQSVDSEPGARESYITAVRDAETNICSFEQFLDRRKQCEKCHKWKQNLDRCGNCKTAYYCNSDCQKKDWPTHKKLCNKNENKK